ncbi:recombination protein NinB [Cronobacter sakazakii]|nr:recombination protein NinB [Cronobacter sakazakii]
MRKQTFEIRTPLVQQNAIRTIQQLYPDPLKGQRSAPGINGGFVVLGQSTSKMKVSEFSELLELIYAFGAERGVQWSEDAQEAIEWAKRTGRKVAV